MLTWISEITLSLFNGIGTYFVKLLLRHSSHTSQQNELNSTGKTFVGRRFISRIVTNGLDFFYSQLETATSTGGRIFTTAIFENYANGDKVREKLLTIKINTKQPQLLTFIRLVVLDDPTQEIAWIHNFLLLRSEIDPDINGYIFDPIIKRVATNNRPLIHKFLASLPRVTLTLVEFNRKANKHLIYIGFPYPPKNKRNNFGIVFNSENLYKRLNEYINFYCTDTGQLYVNTYSETSHLPNIDYSKTGLSERIIDAIQEIASIRSDILHVGLFGSYAMVYKKLISSDKKIEEETDIDFVIVIDRRANINDIKELIHKTILSQKLSTDPVIEIEWSNLEGKYYEYRNGFHIDIQLHRIKDNYYTSQATLLGYSVFNDYYTVIYSSSNETVDFFLYLPQKIPSIKDRLSLLLSSNEYSLETSIKRIKEERYINKTDPCRLFWICLANVVWALSGIRPHTKDSALSYITTNHLSDDDAMIFINNANELLSTYNRNNFDNNEILRNICYELLLDLKKCLIESISYDE